MATFLKAVACIWVWLFFTLIGGIIGAWWPIRNVDEPWAGDGIGMMLFGIVGILMGAMVGLMAIALYLWNLSRLKSKNIPERRD